jgi:hypothetical protein
VPECNQTCSAHDSDVIEVRALGDVSGVVTLREVSFSPITLDTGEVDWHGVGSTQRSNEAGEKRDT